MKYRGKFVCNPESKLRVGGLYRSIDGRVVFEEGKVRKELNRFFLSHERSRRAR